MSAPAEQNPSDLIRIRSFLHQILDGEMARDAPLARGVARAFLLVLPTCALMVYVLKQPPARAAELIAAPMIVLLLAGMVFSDFAKKTDHGLVSPYDRMPWKLIAILASMFLIAGPTLIASAPFYSFMETAGAAAFSFKFGCEMTAVGVAIAALSGIAEFVTIHTSPQEIFRKSVLAAALVIVAAKVGTSPNPQRASIRQLQV